MYNRVLFIANTMCARGRPNVLALTSCARGMRSGMAGLAAHPRLLCVFCHVFCGASCTAAAALEHSTESSPERLGK